MDIVDRYLAYAAAFEESYEDDDWSRIEAYFTENAVYEGEPDIAQGRQAVLAKLKGGVDSLDRRMDSRTPSFDDPKAQGDTVHMDWKVVFCLSGCSDLVISGHETARFEGDRIAMLRDDLDPEAEAAIGEWMATYGDKLGS